MTTLKEARRGQIEKFIKERENDKLGDIDKLDKALKRPASRKSKEALVLQTIV